MHGAVALRERRLHDDGSCILQVIRRSGGTLFDDFVFVDWSARNQPASGEDSIWTCAGSFDARGRLVIASPENPPTRALAAEDVTRRASAAVASGRRMLVGFDFAYGLPAPAYACLLGAGASWETYWRELARRIHDDARNTNDRFVVASAFNAATPGEGPFWGAPRRSASASLACTKPAPARSPLPELRDVEVVLRASRRRPFSVWQLYGSGSVGGQALVGIPRLERMRRHPLLAPHTVVWPFEDGWRDRARGRSSCTRRYGPERSGSIARGTPCATRRR